MADVITGASADVGAGQLTNQVIESYDRKAYFALRENAVFDATFSVKPGSVTSPGTPVTFTFWADMAPATTPLDESLDLDSVGLSDSQVSVTPDEYGNAVRMTARLKADDFLAGWDSDVANLLAYNAVDTTESLAEAALTGGTNVEYVGQASEGAVTAGNILTADIVRRKHAELRGANVMDFGGMYVAIIHPDVAYDLKSETGDGAWVAPAQYVNTERIYKNEIGTFGGFRFVENSRARLNPDGGSGTVDTYTTYFMGQQAGAKAVSIPLNMVEGPVVDKLRRFFTLGWHTYAGWDTFREAALERVVGASSIGAN